jgi:ABC-type uncharacterized transport system permease subunit
MLSGITTFCFGASYTVALALEVVGLKFRFGWHRLVMLLFAMAGLVAHTIYLAMRVGAEASPLASPSDWFLLAAWLVAAIYVVASLWFPRSAVGLFILPLALALIGASLVASDQPFAGGNASRVWGLVHGTLLLLATITVSVGFLAGLMYLIQSWRLKHKLPPSPRFRLPSLEWLEHVNSRSLALSAVLVAGGFLSGLALLRLEHRGERGYNLWTDPVVLSLAAMFLWLVAAEIFRWLYPPARRGRKVAYLTLASFVFLVVALASVTLMDRLHGGARSEEQGASGEARRGQDDAAREFVICRSSFVIPSPLATRPSPFQ